MHHLNVNQKMNCIQFSIRHEKWMEKIFNKRRKNTQRIENGRKLHGSSFKLARELLSSPPAAGDEAKLAIKV